MAEGRKMAKLSTLKPRFGSLAPRLGYAPGDEKARDRQRRVQQPSKQWLTFRRWRETRQRILVRDLYACQMCGVLVAGKGEAQIDHKRPHNEDPALFWCSDDGLQTLCLPCHTSRKQGEERRAGLIR